MKRIVCYILFLFLTQISTVNAADVKLRLALEHWPPYIDRYQNKKGVAAEIVITALKRAGYQVSSSFDEWSDTLEGAGIGVFDVIAAAWHSDKREVLFEYSEPYLFNRIVFIKRKDKSYTFNSFEDLRGMLIGTVSQYAYGKEFDEPGLLIKLPASHLLQNLSLLQQGKIDLTLDDEQVLRHQLRTYMPGTSEQFEFLEKPLTTRALHLMVSRTRKDHKEIVAAFNETIIEMKKDGSFDQILDSYKGQYRFLKQAE